LGRNLIPEAAKRTWLVTEFWQLFND